MSKTDVHKKQAHTCTRRRLEGAVSHLGHVPIAWSCQAENLHELIQHTHGQSKHGHAKRRYLWRVPYTRNALYVNDAGSLSLSLYIYIYIEREIERESKYIYIYIYRERCVCILYIYIYIYIYIYTCIYAYVYIHIYIYIYVYIYIYIYMSCLLAMGASGHYADELPCNGAAPEQLDP